MFDSHQKPTGIRYTVSTAVIATALIFIPFVLAMSGPLSYTSISVSLVLSASCLLYALFDWKRCSQLTIPSIVTSPPRSR